MDIDEALFNLEMKKITGQVQTVCGLAVDLEEPGEAFERIKEMLSHMLEQVTHAQETFSEVVFDAEEGTLD